MSIETIYPDGPKDVPPTFARPTASYRQRAWIAVGGLLLFILVYFALVGWFVYTGIVQVARAGANAGFAPIFVGACSLFLAFFMIKALFFIRKGSAGDGIELKREEQPRLFAFLDRVADETGAPRPHKVYISPSVNAAVFYHLSLFNLIFPSRKNLEIGLGLVNMLNLGELKAVIAHEFGHFAQRTMAVGRWVYTTQQVASHIVARRDALDGFLRGLSRQDLRVAWIGWLLGVIVWALRAIVDFIFRLVIITQRALSREMEMQADRVAVSISGSDALVLALHRLAVADDAWDRTLRFVQSETAAKRPPRDMFDIQHALADKLGIIYNDPDYSRRPSMPVGGGASFRVFETELAQPPRMWSTHPMNHEREANAKSTYLFAPADERSGWLIFDQPQALRERMTQSIVGETEAAIVDTSETLRQLDSHFEVEHLKARYRGLYLGFSPVRHVARPNELYETIAITEPIQIESLYPQSLGDELERLRSLEREHALLCSLRDRIYDAPDGVIRHRGSILKRSQLPAAITLVDQERKQVRESLHAALKRIRSLHLSAATRISPAWRNYLEGLIQTLHYAEHALTNVRDAQASLWRNWRQATSRGSISEKAVRNILACASDVHRALSQVFEHASTVKPGSVLLEELGHATWQGLMGEYGLNAPVRANINDWLRLVDGWVEHAARRLSALRDSALDELLVTEAKIAAATQDVFPGQAPEHVPSMPVEYHTVVVGAERGQHGRNADFWEKFQSATGFFPGLARGVAALTIIGGVLACAWFVGRSQLTIYNGLARDVVVRIDGQDVALPPGRHQQITIAGSGDVPVNTRTSDHEPVEDFVGHVSPGQSSLVYTVAAAMPLHRWTASYGSAFQGPDNVMTPQRWQSANADYLFETPPDHISSKTGSGTRSVIGAFSDATPEELVGVVDDKASAQAMLLAHARFDAPDSPFLANWMNMAQDQDGFGQALSARLTHYPNDVTALRAEQDSTLGAAHDEVCARHRAHAQAAPDQPDLAYLATRCLPSGAARDQAFLDGYRRWPQSAWFAMAAGATEAEQQHYSEALAAEKAATASNPVLRTNAATEVLRLERIADRALATTHAIEMAKDSPYVENAIAYEPFSPTPKGPQRAIQMIGEGDLTGAVNTAAHSPLSAHVLRMAAASVGAPADLRAQAQALPAEAGVDPQTLWIALAEGSNPDTPKIKALMSQFDHSSLASIEIPQNMQRFLALCRAGRLEDADRALAGFPLFQRAQAYAASVFILGNRTPDNWRQLAGRALFVSERPYMGM